MDTRTGESAPTLGTSTAGRRRGTRGPALATTVVAGLASTVLCAAVGTARFQRGDAHGYDLGIFSQSAASWAAGRLPTSGVLGGRGLLGDHFSPLTAVFGAAWALWPDPRVLVLLQAVLLGLGTALVARAAVRHLSPLAAAGVATGVLLAHGTLAAARFDVHEVALAVPFLALGATALVERRHLAAGLWVLPVVLVKEDLSATVLAVAAVVALRGQRRLGLLLAGAAVAGLVLAVTTMALVDPGHGLTRLGSFDGAAVSGAGASAGRRALLVVAVVVGGGVLWVRSPVALLAVPTLAWRLASDTPTYVSSALHYDAVLVPVAGVALVDVLRRLPREGRAARTAAWWCALCCAGTTLVVLPPSSLLPALSPAAWRTGPRVVDLRTATSAVPAGAAVAADNSAAPYLLGRAGGDHDVHGWSADQPLRDLPEWVVLTTDRGSVGTSLARSRAWLARVRGLPGVSVREVGATAVVHVGATAVVHLPASR